MEGLKNHINGYLVEGIWSEGGMSTLFLAHNPITHEPLLVKTLPILREKNTLAQERLENEAAILSKCHHPNIPTLLSHGTYKNEPFLALEFLKGASLRNILDQHPVPLKKALSLLLKLASAVSYLHSLGFAHRDLKPENIFLTDEGELKLIDFGLAAPLDTKGRLDYFEGTPFYMSPEAIQESSISTIERDIYAVGMIAYEMILGRITHGKVLLAFLPKGLQKIIAKALLPNPKERYASIQEFSNAIADYLNNESNVQEFHGSDYFFELFEQATKAEKKLHRDLEPREIEECSIETSCTMNRCGLYVATFKKENEIGFIALESTQKGLEGLLASYSFHYILSSIEDESLFTRFASSFERVKKDFSMKGTWGVLNTDTFELQYHTENNGMLLVASKDRPYLTLVESTTKLAENDRIVFIGFHPSPEPEVVQQVLLETEQTPLPKQAETLVQKLQIKNTWLEAEHPVCLLVLIGKKQYK